MVTRDSTKDGGTPAPREALRDLQQIPGIGPSLAADLWNLGFPSAADLKGADPEEMYRRIQEMAGTHVDPCVLYTFRCAVYWATMDKHEPELLKWWNWKGRELSLR